MSIVIFTLVVIFVNVFIFVAWSVKVPLGICTSNIPSPVIPVIVNVHVTSEVPLLAVSKVLFEFRTAVPFTVTGIASDVKDDVTL